GDQVRIATLGAAHGLKGEIRLRLHTDDPTARLVPGARFTTDPADAGPLVLAAVAERSGSTYARFEGHPDRTAAERLRGVVLLADPEPEDDAWVQHLPAHDVLGLVEPAGARTLVPFVTAIVPVVDVDGGHVVVDPPAGLLAADADEAEEAR